MVESPSSSRWMDPETLNAIGLTVIAAVVGLKLYHTLQAWYSWCGRLQALPHPKPRNPWLYHLKDILECPPVPGRENDRIRQHVWQLLQTCGEQLQNHGLFSLVAWSPYRLPFMATPLVFLLDYELIKAAISHPDLQSKGRTYETNQAILKDSVLIADGADWKRMRKLTSKAFSHNVMENVTSSTMNALEEKVYPLWDSGERVDVVDNAKRFALDILGLVAFSYDLGGLDELMCNSKTALAEKNKTLYRVFEEIMEDFVIFSRSGGMHKYFPICPRFRPNMQYLNSTINAVVEKRIKDENDTTKHNDLLQHLFDKDENGEPILSRDELLGNTRTFMFAGHDTTASTMTFILYELSRHPTVVKKLRSEIDPLFDRSDCPTFLELRSCQYLEAVIRETLRLHPPAIFSRMNKTKDIVLKTEKYEYVIPRTTEIIAAPWMVQRNASCSEFDPDRSDTDSAYFPFAIGSRNCVGRELALAEIRAFVARVIRDYDLVEPEEETVTYLRMTLNPNQCRMKFTKRRL